MSPTQTQFLGNAQLLHGEKRQPTTWPHSVSSAAADVMWQNKKEFVSCRKGGGSRQNFLVVLHIILLNQFHPFLEHFLQTIKPQLTTLRKAISDTVAFQMNKAREMIIG